MVSVRATYGLAIGCLAYVALTIVALVFAAGQPGVPSLADPSTVARSTLPPARRLRWSCASASSG